jgi:DNA-binding winged helix-turn-helix (wHTH) protein/Flp pilus assembly protein TadD
MAEPHVDLGLSPATTIGNLHLQPAVRQITRTDGAVEIVEPRVMQVLLVLAEDRGEIVRRGLLIERCWMGVTVGEDAINRVISKIRRVAEGIGAEAFRLETIKHVGYRLVELPQAGAPAAAAADSEPAEPPEAPPPARARRRLLILAGIIVAAMSMAGFAWLGPWRSTKASDAPLPDRKASALFAQARDDWASRTRDSLDRSIAESQRLIHMAPDFAPAYASLADGYLLAAEAGSLPDAVAFDGAQHAAEQAMRLDPDLPAVHRAIGYIRYWHQHDAPGAGAEFRTSLQLDPASAQTHFWYANVLADLGETEAADRQFEQARLLDPGSDQIATDYAWALWIAGQDEQARTRIQAIVARHPDLAEAQDCLAMIALARSDYTTYLRAFHDRASLRGEPVLQARSRALDQAFRAGGGTALLRAAQGMEVADQADAVYPDHATAAFYASLAGDRTALLDIMTLADANREAWGDAGYVRRIRDRWSKDPVIVADLQKRVAPPLAE